MARRIKKSLWLGISLLFLVYYFSDYKRHFIYNDDKTKCLTIWQRASGNCFLIPYPYYWPWKPKTNYIVTKNHRNYFGIIWEPKDSFNYKLSIYNSYQVERLNPLVKVYGNNDSMLLEHNLLDYIDTEKGLREKNEMYTEKKDQYNYKYIDVNRVFGIEIFD
ncbi:MAG: hypothetical protein DWQ02_01075 [Bacteroidetes bacterium]|nr:MAG: hypothetical protein DWQ02_01075 [Bacteroidota bacterium]